MAEKPKLPPGPRPRVKRALPPPPGDFIALGKSSASKPRAALEVDIKPQMPMRKVGASAMASTSQKRKDMNPVNPVVAKQARTFSPSFNKSKDPSKVLDMPSMSNVKIIDAQPSELEDLVLAAYAKGNQEEVDGLLCGAVKALKMNRLKPDPMLYLTLTNLAKMNPNLFTSKQIYEHLLQFLRRENIGSSVKPKPNTLLAIMTCNILFCAFHNEETWPQAFIKVYVEDALGDRAWIDNENNKDFVANIAAVFGTMTPPKAVIPVSGGTTLTTSTTLKSSAEASVTKSEDGKNATDSDITAMETDDIPCIQNRFPLHKDEVAIHSFINDIVKDQLNKRQMIDSVSRNMLRFLTAVCGYSEVRLLASQKLETWLQNPKLARPAQELLMSVTLNCNTHSADDIEVIANIVKMRLKAKTVATHYVSCIKELIAQHPDNLGTTLKHIVYNELSPQRNPNNMPALSVIFTTEPDPSASFLSLVFQDLLCNREDYLRALRALFREIVRALKYEVNLVEFCRGMMQERKEAVFMELDQLYKDRMFSSVIDLICLGCFLCVSPAVKELSISLSKGEKRDYSVLQAFQTQISIIQRDAIWFFHTKVMQMYRCSERDFVLGLNRILFLDANEQYCNKDNWPPEAERSIMLQLVREVPIAEGGLLRLHLLGLSDENPINNADALDVVERMVLRAAVLKSGLQGLEIERTEVINMLLSLAAYAHPKDIMLPAGYVPPPLAISALYWKAWLILLVLAANSSTTIGLEVWERYPTARCMMEMLITGCYQFPPLGASEYGSQDIRGNDLQLARAEKDDIIVFEGHLAAATSGSFITESSSLLVRQLISLQPTGPPRLPPPNIIERLKSMNETFRLGKMLCQSRDPDFLLSIIQSQGSSRSMPWLAELVQSSEGSLNSLPVQCLCEFLLMKYNAPDIDISQSRNKSIKPKVAARLQELLLGNEATEQSSCELIRYFIHRWSSPEMRDREAAVNALQSIVLLQKRARGGSSMEDGAESQEEIKTARKYLPKMTIIKDNTYTWLHEKIPNLPYFKSIMSELMLALKQALNVEIDIQRLQAYVIFLCNHHETLGEVFTEQITEDLAQLITCRKTIVKNLVAMNNECGVTTYNLLLELFCLYIKSQLKPAGEEHQWHSNLDKVSITWQDGALHAGYSTLLNLRVIHASIALLTYGSFATDEANYVFLLHTWFPTAGSIKCREATTGEGVEILQHWLRMLMLQSAVGVLVQAGLKDVPYGQLLTFLHTSGIPVSSTSLLLTLLDEAAEKGPEKLCRDISDRDSIIQLVTLAHSRGAQGGEKLCTLLQCDYKKANDSISLHQIAKDLSVITMDDQEMTQLPCSSVPAATDSVKDLLRNVFMLDDQKILVSNFNQLKRKLALGNIKSDQENIHTTVILNLLDLLNGDKFLKQFCSNRKESKFLLNCLSKGKGIRKEDILGIHQKLSASASRSVEVDKMLNEMSEKYDLVEKSSKARSINRLLNSFLKCKNEVDLLDTGKEVITEIKKKNNLEELDKHLMVKVFKLILKKCRKLSERFVQALCTSPSSSKSVNTCVEILVEVCKTCEANDCGMIIDWITILDPEVLHANPILQREFLFLERNKVSTTAGNKSTSYLASMLAHQTRNTTLEDCLTWLLSSQSDVNNFDASSCLDLLSAMFNNPRLWQGRENRRHEESTFQFANANDKNEIEISIHVQHLYRLINLMLCELTHTLKDVQSDDEGSLTALMEKRLVLLLNLSMRDSKKLKKAINLVRQAKKFPEDVIVCFLKYLYMKSPTILPNFSRDLASAGGNLTNLPDNNKTKMDELIHGLISSISEPTGTPEWEERFKSISPINRRLAVHHPFAFIRQLPFTLSMLKGKSRMVPTSFKLTNQMLFCTHVFGLFDLLRPYVFAENELSKETMSLFLEVFIELIQSSCVTQDECATFVKKLVEFLNHYIASGNKDVVNVLKKYEDLFRDLMYDFPNFEGLTSIYTLISSCTSSTASNPSILAVLPTPWNEMQLVSFKRRLSTDRHFKDLLAVLVDLDETSKRRTDVIQHFIKELSLLTFSTHQDVRDKSHVLLLRHCKQQPRDSTQLINLYLDCFQSDNPDIVSSAALHTPQALLLSHEKCDILLKSMYDVFIRTTNKDIKRYITMAVKSYNIDCT